MDLAELLSNSPDVDTLDDLALATFRDDVRAATREARGEAGAPVPGELLELLRRGAELHKTATAELATRAEASAQTIRDADAVLAEFGDDGGSEPAAGEQARDEVPEALAASVRPRRAVNVPAKHAPRVAARGVTTIRRQDTDAHMDLAAATEFFHRRASDIRRAGGDGGTVFQLDWRDSYGDDRRLHGDPGADSEKLFGRRDEMVLLASGGVPGPPEARYAELTFGQANRPVRDALAGFLASRGELVWNVPISLDDIVVESGAGSAVNVLTSAQDASNTTKTFQTTANPTTASAVVRAVTQRLQLSNFGDRFLPERTASYIKLATIAHAREGEKLLLADIKAASTQYTNVPAKFGAYRDFKRAFLGQTEEIEDHVRDANVPLHVIVPEFLPGMLAADMISQAPGDSSFEWTEEKMRADLQSWDPNVTWTFTPDSIRGRTLTSPSGQSPKSAGFDQDVEWCMYPEGTFAFLDGGVLDLAIVRDSVLSQTNAWQTFVESFEALAKVGPFSYWITSSLCADGASQAAAAVNICSVPGS